ncbi:MAG: 2-oxoacid:acceptor oxidoreductase family protein, partial [Candidatus Methylarchaceae archaeon HK02M2]|nr:2-oxoacid:acceptor oxidoreductase family protein [Candidatus Methylarchaceae archaeon HK02M2]
MVEINFRVGGEAGQGIQTVGYILAKTFVRGNLYVYTSQDYESRIRGGHNFFHIRVSDNPVYGTSEKVDLLIALNKETLDIHTKALTENGVVIFDGEKTKIEKEDRSQFAVPFQRLAEETANNKIFSNTVAIGVALSLVKYDFEILGEVLKEIFKAKSKQVAENNIKAAEVGYRYAKENFKGKLPLELEPIEGHKRMLIGGNEALALGALAAGCKFMCGYPMTPSTGILQYMLNKSEKFKIVVEQAEDEIAALNMALGASFTGVRAMTATSGGGFSLMVEALS